jgi:hypothetical protein
MGGGARVKKEGTQSDQKSCGKLNLKFLPIE